MGLYNELTTSLHFACRTVNIVRRNLAKSLTVINMFLRMKNKSGKRNETLLKEQHYSDKGGHQPRFNRGQQRSS